jgi:hypothetical protein
VDPEDVREAPRRVREGPLQHPHRTHASHPQRHDKGLILSILLRFLHFEFGACNDLCFFWGFPGLPDLQLIGSLWITDPILDL